MDNMDRNGTYVQRRKMYIGMRISSLTQPCTT